VSHYHMESHKKENGEKRHLENVSSEEMLSPMSSKMSSKKAKSGSKGVSEAGLMTYDQKMQLLEKEFEVEQLKLRVMETELLLQKGKKQ
jgi:hypothetical protein